MPRRSQHRSRTVTRTLVVPLTLVVAAAGAGVGAPAASAIDPVDSSALRRAVTVNGILSHERALQRIADQNGGNRASGTTGYTDSARYVRSTLQKAGYQVRTQYFTFPLFQELAPATLVQVSPVPTTYETATVEYSGSGSVTGTVVPIAPQIPPPAEAGTTTSGCTGTPFPAASPTQPQIALVQRGFCTFGEKAANAAAAGYDAVVVFNEGQEGRTELLTGVTLGGPTALPVVGLSFADGADLVEAAQAGPVTLTVTTSTESRTATTSNLLADTPGGKADEVVVVGAHLDSVLEGPGINDNGSGTAGILEIAEQMAALRITPERKVRFAFWGAEEAGLLGSEHYVASLSPSSVSRLYANLNFDMIGSPNYARFVYDGDGSATPDAAPLGPPGSAQIEQLFGRYFRSQGLATEPTAFDGRSDYGPFIAAGIPAGGLFTGAEGIKTAAQARKFGGTAGVAFDPNYHQAGDTILNLNTKALQEMGDAAAHAVFALATSKSGLFGDGSRQAARATTAGSTSFEYKGSHLVR